MPCGFRVFLCGTSGNRVIWFLCSDFLLHPGIKKSSQPGSALFCKSPSEAKKLAVMWEGVLYHLELRKVWKVMHRWLSPDHPLRITSHMQHASCSTHSLRLHPPAHVSCEPLSAGAWSPTSNRRRAPWKLTRIGTHWPPSQRLMGQKNGSPISLTSTAKSCADIYQYSEKGTVCIQIKYKDSSLS